MTMYFIDEDDVGDMEDIFETESIRKFADDDEGGDDDDDADEDDDEWEEEDDF